MSLNLNKPLTFKGRDATVIHRFDSGNVVVVVDGDQDVYQFDRNGRRKIRSGYSSYDKLENRPVEKVDYYTIYPSGEIYPSCTKSSQYDLDDLVRVRVTRINGHVVKKEFVD